MVSVVERSTIVGYADVENQEIRCVRHATPLWLDSNEVVTLHLDNPDLDEMWCEDCYHSCFTEGVGYTPSLKEQCYG